MSKLKYEIISMLNKFWFEIIGISEFMTKNKKEKQKKFHRKQTKKNK